MSVVGCSKSNHGRNYSNVLKCSLFQVYSCGCILFFTEIDDEGVIEGDPEEPIEMGDDSIEVSLFSPLHALPENVNVFQV